MTDIYDLNIVFYKKLTEEELPEDTWVRGWEFRTGDNNITHHMCSSTIPPSAQVHEDGTAVEGDGTDGVDAAEGCQGGGAPHGPWALALMLALGLIARRRLA